MSSVTYILAKNYFFLPHFLPPAWSTKLLQKFRILNCTCLTISYFYFVELFIVSKIDDGPDNLDLIADEQFIVNYEREVEKELEKDNELDRRFEKWEPVTSW